MKAIIDGYRRGYNQHDNGADRYEKVAENTSTMFDAQDWPGEGQ